MKKEVLNMKKVLMVALMAFGTMALTGCEMIQSLLKGEKQYNNADFKVLIADAAKKDNLEQKEVIPHDHFADLKEQVAEEGGEEEEAE